MGRFAVSPLGRWLRRRFQIAPTCLWSVLSFEFPRSGKAERAFMLGPPFGEGWFISFPI